MGFQSPDTLNLKPIPKKKLEVVLYTPHEAQLAMHQSKARFRVCAFGRRAGKSLAASNELVKIALETPRVRCAWVAPTYKQTAIGGDLIIEALKSIGAVSSTKRSAGQLTQIDLTNGSRIYFFSATNPDTIRGNSFHFLVIDEFAFIPRNVWDAVLRPCLSDTLGRALLISTPFGRGLFYEMFQLGQDPSRKTEFESFHHPTASNPYIAVSEIEQAQDTLPELVFQQEYLAEFLESGAGVFRNIRQNLQERLQLLSKGHPDRYYVFGVDWAKKHDFTVVIGMDRDSREVVYYDRFNQVSWAIQLDRVCAAAKKFGNAKMIVDSTGVGEPLFEQLRDRGFKVIGYSLASLPAKNRLIENLAAHMDQNLVSYPDIPVLTNELEIYQYNLSDKTGKIMYSAPDGRNDDCVPPDTWIRTRFGMKQIKDVQVGDEVLTHLSRYRKVLRTGSRFADKVYRYTFTGKPCLLTTSNHRLYLFDRKLNYKDRTNTVYYENPSWKSIDDLDIPKLLAKYGASSTASKKVLDVKKIDLAKFAPDTYEIENDKLVAYIKGRGKKHRNPKQNILKRFLDVDENLCYILGYYFAEGSTGAHNVGFASHADEQALRDFVIRYFKDLGLNPCELQTSENGYIVSFGSVILNRFFNQSFKHHENKVFPFWVENLPINKQQAILAGYHLGDGSFADKGKAGAVTISPTGAIQLYEMHLRAGLAVGLTRRPGQDDHKEQWVLNLDAPEAKKLKQFIPKELLVAKNVTDSMFKHDQTQIKLVDGYAISKIRKITEIDYNDIVYNLEVEEDNSYIANGTIVHNCVVALALATWGCHGKKAFEQFRTPPAKIETTLGRVQTGWDVKPVTQDEYREFQNRWRWSQAQKSPAYY